METYKELLKTVSGIRNKDDLDEKLQGYFLKSKIFLTESIGQDQIINVDLKNVSTPFEFCFIEYLNSVKFNEYNLRLEACLIHSTSHNKYEVYVFSEVKEQNKTRINFFNVDLDSPPDFSKEMKNDNNLENAKSRIAFYFILDFIKSLKTNSSGKINYKEKIKVKTKSGNIFHKINDIIYISNNKSKPKTDPVYRRDINWSHRWQVMGHWRKTKNKIGHDRFGNIITTGYTWVKDYKKGPEHLELVDDKIRIIGGNNYETMPVLPS